MIYKTGERSFIIQETMDQKYYIEFLKDFNNILKKYSFDFGKICEAAIKHYKEYNVYELYSIVMLLNKIASVSGNINFTKIGDMLLKSIDTTADQEQEIELDIIENFSKIFTDYNLIKRQYPIKVSKNVIYHIDMLAEDKVSHQKVIMELKRNSVSTEAQLHKYQKFIPSAKLVSVNRGLPQKIFSDIEYWTYDYCFDQIAKECEFIDKLFDWRNIDGKRNG